MRELVLMAGAIGLLLGFALGWVVGAMSTISQFRNHAKFHRTRP